MLKIFSFEGYITRALGTFHSSMRAAYKFSEDLKRLPRNPNKSGLLTDLPDYTFLDGRVTPLGVSRSQLCYRVATQSVRIK